MATLLYWMSIAKICQQLWKHRHGLTPPKMLPLLEFVSPFGVDSNKLKRPVLEEQESTVTDNKKKKQSA